jgi:hypothetical protein
VGKLKSVVYAKNPHDLEALKQNIREEIYNIQQRELQQVSQNLFKALRPPPQSNCNSATTQLK